MKSENEKILAWKKITRTDDLDLLPNAVLVLQPVRQKGRIVNAKIRKINKAARALFGKYLLTPVTFLNEIVHPISPTIIQSLDENQSTAEVPHSEGKYDLALNSSGRKTIVSILFSRKQLVPFIESYSDIITTSDTRGVFTYVSPACESVLGYTRDQMVGKHNVEFIHPDDIPQMMLTREKLLSSGNIEKFIFRARMKNGSYVTLETSSRAIRDENGNILFIQSSARNISERIKMEDDLKQMNELLLDAQTIAKTGHWLHDLRSGARLWSDQLFKLFGVDRSSGHSVEQILDKFIVPEDLSKVRKVEQVAAENGEPYETTYRVRLEDGTEKTHLIRAYPELDDKKKPVRIKGVCQDITERIDKEVELRNQKNLYEALLNAQSELGEGVGIIGENKFIYINDALLRICGCSKEELDPPAFFSMIEGEDKNRLSAVFLNEFDRENIPSSGEMRIRNFRGEMLHLAYSVKFQKTTGRIKAFFIIRNITSQKVAETTLKQREIMLDRINNLIPGLICVYNINSGRVIFVNDFISKMLGYSKHELLQKGVPFLKSLIHPADADNLISKNNEILAIANDIRNPWQDDQTVSFEYRLKDSAGNYRWILTTGTIFDRNEEGKVEHLVNISFDITERKKNEEAIIRAEEQLSEAQRIASLGSWEWDIERNRISWSEELYRMYGFEPDEIEVNYELYLSRIHPEDREKVHAIVSSAFESRNPFSFEHKIITPSGITRILHGKGRVITDESGRPVKMIGSALDITERKLFEEQLKNFNAALSDIINERTEELNLSQARFQFLAESIPQVVWTASPEGNIDYFNNKWFELTGLSHEDSKGMQWIEMLHRDDQEPTKIKWNVAMKTGHDLQVECRLKNHADKKFRWYLGRALPIRNDNGKIVKWFGTLTDIHEQKILLNKKEEFMSIASHELKTPLTSVKAYVQLLERLENIANDPVASVYIKKAGTHIDKLNALISDLLDVTRIQAGKLVMCFTDFDFDTLVKESIDNIQYTSRQKIILEGASGVRITGERHRLEQVFSNLISNALKYSPNSDRVIVSVSADEKEITVKVRDFGIGIPSAYLEKIFDRFYRVEEISGRFSGLGIGLYITAEIIRRHNGRIWAESEPGKGSVFSFVIPFEQNIE